MYKVKYFNLFVCALLNLRKITGEFHIIFYSLYKGILLESSKKVICYLTLWEKIAVCIVLHNYSLVISIQLKRHRLNFVYLLPSKCTLRILETIMYILSQCIIFCHVILAIRPGIQTVFH